MKIKPRVFVGSSKESIDVVYALNELLSEDAEIIPWKHADFELSKTFVENIEKELNKSDFGIFIFTGDDQIISRNNSSLGVRDNVIFEFGLFTGVLGRERTYIVTPDTYGTDIKVLSDMLGVTVGIYPNSNPDIKVALGNTASKIRKLIKKYDLRKNKSSDVSHRIRNVIPRGGTEYIDILADAALFVGEHRNEYSKELKRRLKNKEIVPMKYLYRTEQASNHWLNICKKESYLFYKNSMAILNSKVDDIVDAIINCIGENEIDFISIGSGDGNKDNILLRGFIKKLKDNEYIYYYPVDISDTLIEAAVKNSAGRGISKNKLKMKALLADFNQLVQLQKFYEERTEYNVFSVLGNTIGNADESDLIKSISDSMLPGDVVLIEINIGSIDLNDPLLRTEDNMKHDFAPLASLGIQLDSNLLEYTIENTYSIIDGTCSLLAKYREAEIDGDNVKDIKLSIVHHYNFEKFKNTIERHMNVKTIYFHEQNGVGLIVAQRQKNWD